MKNRITRMTMMNLNAPPPFLGGAAEGVSTSIAPEFEPEAEAEPGVEVADEAAATFAPHLIQNGEPVSTVSQAGQTTAADAGSAVGGTVATAGPTFAPHFTQNGAPVSSAPQAGHAFAETTGADATTGAGTGAAAG